MSEFTQPDRTPDPPDDTQPSARPSPYVGPRSFRDDEKDKLFGRERELRELRELLIAERIVLLYSPSGAGKTSLIRAALIPDLISMHFRVPPPIRVYQELPYDAPPTANRFLYSTLLALEEGQPKDQLVDQNSLLTFSLATYLERLLPLDTAGEIVLVFDQFEEVLAIEPANLAAKQDFFEQLGTALEDRRIWALFALREDYLAALDPFLEPIPNRFKDTFRLNLLDPSAAQSAIQEPPRAAGVTLANDAAKRLVDDLRRTMTQRPDGTSESILGPYIEPVQLQVVCLRLWEKLFGQHSEHQPIITLADVESVGNVDHALAAYYAERVRLVAEATGVPERSIRDWFDQQLITRDGRRNQVMKQPNSSAKFANHVIDKLIDTHLVRGEERRGTIWYELAHDRLILPIQNDNSSWREAHLSILQRRAAQWVAQDRPEDLLLQGDRLAAAKAWAGDHAEELIDVERDFLKACQDREKAERTRRLLRRLAFVAGIITALLLALIIFLFFRARQNERMSSVLQLATQARQEADLSPQLSLLLALKAFDTSEEDDAVRPVAVEALRELLARVGGTPLRGHTGPVQAVAFSPDSRWIATASFDSTVRLWSVDTPTRPVAILRGHTEEVLALAFSPDGRWLASASEDDSVRLWQVTATDRPPIILRESTQDMFAIAFSPDSSLLATQSVDGTIFLWETQAAEHPLAVLNAGRIEKPTLAFSFDGTLLATGSSDGTTRVWEVNNPTVDPITLKLDGLSVVALAFSPHGYLLAIGASDGTTLLWQSDTPTRTPLRLSGHSVSTEALAFSPNGRWLVTGSLDGTVRLWQMDSLEADTQELESALLGEHLGGVYAVAFSADSRWLVTSGEDKMARLWRTDAFEQEPVVLHAHEQPVRAVAFSPDGTWLATGGQDNMARLWPVRTPQTTPIVVHGVVGQKHVAFNHDGTLLATGGDDGTVQLVRVGSPESTPIVLKEDDQALAALAFSPDGMLLVTGSMDGTVRVWLPQEPARPPIVLKRRDDLPVAALAFSPNGTLLVTGSWDGTARLWRTGALDRPPVVLKGHDPQVRAVAFSPNSELLATGGAEGTVRLWRTDAPDNPLAMFSTGRGVVTVAFSPNGRWLAAGAQDGMTWLWRTDIPEAAPIPLEGHTAEVHVVAFSPDGQWLATGSWDKSARLWPVEASERTPINLRAHAHAINTLAFSPDGKWLATGSFDGTAGLWEVAAQPRAPTILRGHTQGVYMLAFSAAGDLLATASFDGTTRLWRTNASDIASLACAATGRNLSLEEWRQLVGTDVLYDKLCPELPRHPTVYSEMLEKGEIDQARRDYAEDQQRDPTLEPMVVWLIQMAGDLSVEKMDIALGIYDAALDLDSQLNGADFESLNQLCANGTVPQYATAVLEICERAARLAPNDNKIRYNRGKVRAMTGDLTGAIEDFQAFTELAPGYHDAINKIPQVQQWITTLKAGNNPLEEARPTPVK